MSNDTDSPQQVEVSMWRRAADFGPAIGALAVVGAALAYYSGLLYAKAYAKEWGVSFAALHYDTYQLMTASATILTLAVTLPTLGIAFFLLRAMYFEEGPPAFKKGWRRVTILIGAIAVLVLLLAFTLQGFGYPHQAIFSVVASVILLGIAVGLPTRKPRNSIQAVSLVALALFVSVFLLAPSILGRADARSDRDQSQRLTRVELLSIRPLGLEGEHRNKELFQSGPWRIVFASNGYIWLTTPTGGERSSVYQVAERDIASLRYLPDPPRHQKPTKAVPLSK